LFSLSKRKAEPGRIIRLSSFKLSPISWMDLDRRPDRSWAKEDRLRNRQMIMMILLFKGLGLMDG
jgi:hypothetical protein